MTVHKNAFVYPGHPVVIAMEILESYPSLLAAQKGTDKLPSAIANGNIRGAGGCVRAAEDVLSFLMGGLETELALKYADNYWATSVSEENKARECQAKADALKSSMLEAVKKWSKE